MMEANDEDNNEATLVHTEPQCTADEEQGLPYSIVGPDAVNVMDDGSSVEGYSDAQGEEDQENNLSQDGNDNNNSFEDRETEQLPDFTITVNNNSERDLELGFPLADLDSEVEESEEEEDEEDEDTTEDADENAQVGPGSVSWQRRIFYALRFGLHVVFFPILVITSVAIPVLIVMFCFALMFVALLVLLCVYYCCSPRRGDQSAVPFHVLIRQILEAVEDETHGLGDQSNDTPKYSREEIKNAMVRRKLIHFECSDADGNVVEDPQPTDEATREERMHQDMYPIMSELKAPPAPAPESSEEPEEPKATGFKGFRERFSNRRQRRKSVEKKVEAIDHNKTYELRLAQQNIKFETNPAANNSKLFLLKRTFVFSPPLGPEQIKPPSSRSRIFEDNNHVMTNYNATAAQGTRNYNLTIAALEDDDESSSSSSSASDFLWMRGPSNSSSSDSSSSSLVTQPEAATAQSSDVSFISEDENDRQLDLPGNDNSDTGEGMGSISNESIHDYGNPPAPNLSPDDGSNDPLSETSSPIKPSISELASNDLHMDLDAVLDVESGIASSQSDSNEEEKDTVAYTEQRAATSTVDVGVAREKATNSTEEVNNKSYPKLENPEEVIGEGANSDNEKEGNDSAQDGWVASTAPVSSGATRKEVHDECDTEKADALPFSAASGAEISIKADQGDDQLVSIETKRKIGSGMASDLQADEDVEGAKVGNTASLVVHPDCIPLENSKTEITLVDAPEEPKTEIETCGGLPAELNVPSYEEAKTEADAFEGEIQNHSPSAEPSQIDPIMTTAPKGPTTAIDASAEDEKPVDLMPSTPPSEQPDHRGISSYCNICLLEYEVGDIVVWSRRPQGCHHAWHEDCLLDWLQRKPTCPNCRQEFFAIEDAPQQQEVPAAAEVNQDSNSLIDYSIVPESDHSIPG